MDADPKLDSLVDRHRDIALDHGALDFDGAAHGFHCAGEFHQHAVAGGLDDVAAMLLDAAVGQIPAMQLELGKRAFLVNAHQPAISRDISRENRH